MAPGLRGIGLRSACALALACGGIPAPPASSVPAGQAVACVVDGTVKHVDGSPIEGALVAVIVPYASIATTSVRTSEAGSFCLRDVPEGDYSLTVTSTIGSAYIEPFATRERGHGLDVRPSPDGFVLEGTVEGAHPGAAAGATVRLIRQSDSVGEVFFVQCDARGRFAAKVPAGQYVAGVETETAAGSDEDIQLDRDAVVHIVLETRNPPERPPPDAVLAWARHNAISLRTVEPGSGFDDLEALRPIIGGARVVALGEATHGTREFRAFSLRLFEFLVERMGFRAAIVEESFAETLSDDAYVRSSDAEEPWRGPLPSWIRTHNRGKTDAEKVRYLGNDLRRPARCVAMLAKAVPRIDATLWREVERDLEPLADDWSTFIDVQIYAPPSPRVGATCAAAERLAARLDERRAEDVQTLGVEPWATAQVHAHILADFTRLMKSKNFAVRDQSMADSTIRLLDVVGPRAKAVLFAHNVHVQKVAAPNGMQGGLMRERLGEDYVAFGSAFDHGAFNAHGRQGWTVFTIGAAPPGSFDGLLAGVKKSPLALDLRSATGAVRRWLDTPTFARSIGSAYHEARPEDYFDRSPPLARLDAVFFVAESTPIDATPRVERGADPPGDAASEAPPVELLNADFEAGRPGEVPAGWQLQSVPEHLRYRARLERGAASGGLALALDRDPDPTPVGYGMLSQRIDARPLRASRVRVSASVQLESHALGDKAFVFAMPETGSTLPYATSGQAVASKAWSVTTIDVDIPANANTLQLGLIVTGAARARIDEVRVQRITP